MSLVLHTKVTAVTVYRNGALVTRMGTMAAPSAPSKLHLPGLPLLFASESLRIRVVGGSADAIEELPELSLAAGVDPEDEAAVRALKSERGRLSRQRATWTARQAAAKNVIIKPPAGKNDAVLPSVGLWLAVEDLTSEEDARCADAVAAIDARLREIAAAEEAIQRRQEAGTATRYTRTLATTLTPDGAPTIQVEVACFIPGARWAPVYRVYVDTTSRRVRLWMGARVAQATGEDWSGVPVSVSTADLTRSARIPELTSWRIGRAMPKPSRWRSLPEGLDGLFADFDAAPRAPVAAEPAPLRPSAPAPARSAPPPSPRRSVPSAAHLLSEMQGRAPMAGSGAPVAMPPSRGAAPKPKSRGAAPKPKKTGPVQRSRGRSVPSPSSTGVFSRPPSAPPPPPPTGIDPGRLLDYAWLRLAPVTDRRRRGKLLPVDLDAEYRSFLEERGGELSRYEGFSKALCALREAQARIWKLGLPSGCFDVRKSSFYHRYSAGPSVDIPADGRFHQITILEQEADCELLLRCVPRQDSRAFRYAQLVNPLSSPLLPGPMQVYLDGAYTVTSQLRQVGARGKLRLNLGVEEQVRIARNTEYHQSERGMISSTSSLEHRIHTELRSRMSVPVTIEVFERLPLTGGVVGIEVELDSASPEPDRGTDPDGRKIDGVMGWRLSLEPGAGADIRYRYHINISARQELIGGNRREP